MRASTKKELGQVNTPDRLVTQMLDFGGYDGEIILRKHVIDNSCGNGQFLVQIVRRYINAALRSKESAETISSELSQYIHGIEIDENICEECRQRLDSIVWQFGIDNVNWDIKCENTLLFHGYDGKMGYVFGNPPYVRIHNVKGGENYDILKGYSFAEKGSSDLYLAFFEYGLSLLNENGVLCYITPSSWLSSASGKNMRKYILDRKTLHAIVDFGHFQVFDDAQTYTSVTLFKNKSCKRISYYEYNDGAFDAISSISYSDICIDGKFYFAKDDELKTLKEIEKTTCDKIRVKNGLATLNDKIFVDQVPDTISDCCTINVLKASTGKWGRCLFPYRLSKSDLGKIESIPIEEIKESYPEWYKYLIDNEGELKARTYDNGSNWWEIGRRQGLNDTFRAKIAMNNLTKRPGDIKITRMPEYTHVYSGLYILTDVPFNTIKQALESEQFFNYVKSLKKYKSGEYYTFSSKDVEKFLNYKIYGNK